MDNELRELFLAAAQITGRDGDALHLVLLRISRRRPEDAAARESLDRLFLCPADPVLRVALQRSSDGPTSAAGDLDPA
jgi:hypothetical protein